jgi:aldehyde dehydrogenase (NAD+)
MAAVVPLKPIVARQAREAPFSASMSGMIGALRAEFELGTTKSLTWRRAQLRGLDTMLVEHEDAFLAALKSDLGKSAAEAISSEIAFVRSEIAHMLQHLGKWTRTEKVKTPWFLQPSRSYIARGPLGVVLIIGAWNLPVAVMLGPFVAALAAGNAVVMKPSELAPATAALIERLVPRYVDNNAIKVIQGGVPETTALLEEAWGHIFYTGNTVVGRIVASAAAKTLSPITLELGGKSPVYVDKDADLIVTARRLVWAKWMNAGQVCVAPDYLLAHTAIIEPLIGEIRKALQSFYGSNPAKSHDYGRIVNARHFDRLIGLLEDHGGAAVHGGGHDRGNLFIEPTLVQDPDTTSALMQTEIFGPILPIVSVSGPQDAIARINRGPKPLVVHVFTKNADIIDKFETGTSSGALVSNDAIVNHRVADLPFGGVGESGQGAYHGRFGFETFSHRKAVMRRSTLMDLALRYPPFDAKKLATMRKMIGF